MLLAFACAAPRGQAPVHISSAPAPSADESYCAWYGDRRDDVLYFGESPFWSAMRATADPLADQRTPGPQRVGRFDLRREVMLDPLETGASAPRAGVWDVLAHPDGRIYFTTFFESAGSIDLATGATSRFDAAGTGLNELALLPDGRLLATRYGTSGGTTGAVVVLDEDGSVEAELTLAASPGSVAAAKSVAFDPVRRVVWVNTDVISRGAPPAHDARVLDLASGREQLRIEEPELQFMRFGPDGRGWFAWRDGDRLVLRVTEPGAAQDAASGRAIPLDDAYAGAHDFVQDMRIEADGRAVVTRWSGHVHVVAPDGRVRSVVLPQLAEGGLYYTATAVGDRVCATYCAGVTVVCAPLP